MSDGIPREIVNRSPMELRGHDKILGTPNGSGADEDVFSDNGRLMQKKAHFDDELEERVEEIQNILGFHHCVVDLYFNLDHPKLLVWAAVICSGKATKEKAPMGSNLFKPQHSLKKLIARNTKSVPLAPVQAPAEPVPPQGPQFPAPTQFQFPMPRKQPPIQYGYPYSALFMLPLNPMGPYSGMPMWPSLNQETTPCTSSLCTVDHVQSSPLLPNCRVHNF
ncbi:hypothetical protein B0H10DRAFT_1942166 [Mycena sp. CBHHK59/15]|nr:hypothetical protein B0H10DRAFT_1942166 [Mycena sp. CBHHK59/15]